VGTTVSVGAVSLGGKALLWNKSPDSIWSRGGLDLDLPDLQSASKSNLKASLEVALKPCPSTCIVDLRLKFKLDLLALLKLCSIIGYEL